MRLVKIACGTDDGVTYSSNHFGSSKYYLIYELNLTSGETKFIKKINNISVKEQTHGDPLKAKSVSKLLSDVNILISKVMGLNINRMRKNFIIIISRINDINDSLNKLKNVLDDIKVNLMIPKGEDKSIIYLKSLS